MKLNKNKYPEHKVEFWKNHLNIWKKRKISQAKYCKQNNLNQNMFSKWKRILSTDKEKLSLVELPLTAIKHETLCSEIELIINESIKIRLDDNFNQELLKKILKIFGVII